MYNRIKELQKNMNKSGIDLAIIMHPRDLYYYTGTAQPCNLIVPVHGEPFLQVRRAWDFVCRETWIPPSQMVAGGNFNQIEQLAEELPLLVRTIGLTLDAIPAILYKKAQAGFSQCNLVDISPLVLRQRAVKDEEERKAVRQAAGLFRVVHHTIMASLRAGIREIDLAACIIKSLREHEAETIVRNRRWDSSLHPEGLVVSSTNMWRISGHAMTVTGVGLSPSLAWGASTTVINKGDLVVVDLGINLHGYHADMCRTYCVGHADDRQKEVFGMVLEIQEEAIKNIKEGVSAEKVYYAALKKARELGVEQNFQGYGNMQGQYVGHGIGLELDEPPTLQLGNNMLLQDGMTLAVEPKLIIPGWGAVVLEDDVMVTREGCEMLSNVPRQLFEV